MESPNSPWQAFQVAEQGMRDFRELGAERFAEFWTRSADPEADLAAGRVVERQHAIDAVFGVGFGRPGKAAHIKLRNSRNSTAELSNKFVQRLILCRRRHGAHTLFC